MLSKDRFTTIFFFTLGAIAIMMVGTGTIKEISKNAETSTKYEYAKYVDSQYTGPIIILPDGTYTNDSKDSYDEKNKTAVKYLLKEKNDIKCFNDEKMEAGLKRGCSPESVLTALGHQGWQVYDTKIVPVPLPLAQMQEDIRKTTGARVEFSDLIQAAANLGGSNAQAYFLKRVAR